jgi:fructose-bisphosphate aldolase, class I
MNAQGLIDTARTLVASDKGPLAMDESSPTCNKLFAQLGIPQTEEARRAYRELIVTTPGLGDWISGVILYDETIRQQKKDSTPFLTVVTDAGIIPGIKVDIGAEDIAGHRGESNRRAGRNARPPGGLRTDGRPFCQVAGGTCRE